MLGLPENLSIGYNTPYQYAKRQRKQSGLGIAHVFFLLLTPLQLTTRNFTNNDFEW